MLREITNPKSVYDSIMTQDVSIRHSSIGNFFEQFKDHPNQSQLALCHHEYARKIYRTDLNAAITHANTAIEIRQQLQDTLAMSKSLYALGYFHHSNDDYQGAIDAYKFSNKV